jgi:hypothetical protein
LPSTKGDHGFGDKRQIEENYVRDTLRPVFGQLSGGFQGALIVPGTVAWRKSILPASTAKHASPQEAAAYRLDKYTKRLESTVDINMFEPDGGMGNYPFTQNTTVFPAKYKHTDDTRSTIPTLADKINLLKTAHYIAKNTAHCYLNGNPVCKYNKIGDFYEIPESNPDTVNVPNRSTVSGTTTGAGRFAADGKDFGISICFDQSLSVQDTSKQVNPLEPIQKTAGPVDFHILLSAYISPRVGDVNLKSGGYLLSCSSKADYNQVIRSDNHKLNHDQTEKIDGTHTLYLFKIT